MAGEGVLAAALRARMEEECELTARLLGMLPEGSEGWRPPYDGFSCGELAAHLVDTMAGFCAALGRRRDGWEWGREAAIEESRRWFGNFREDAMERISAVGDEGLRRVVPTVFAPEGQPLLAILLANLAHLINHKHQLFTYLKLMGLEVGSRDLYRFRDAR